MKRPTSATVRIRVRWKEKSLINKDTDLVTGTRYMITVNDTSLSFVIPNKYLSHALHCSIEIRKTQFKKKKKKL